MQIITISKKARHLLRRFEAEPKFETRQTPLHWRLFGGRVILYVQNPSTQQMRYQYKPQYSDQTSFDVNLAAQSTTNSSNSLSEIIYRSHYNCDSANKRKRRLHKQMRKKVELAIANAVRECAECGFKISAQNQIEWNYWYECDSCNYNLCEQCVSAREVEKEKQKKTKKRKRNRKRRKRTTTNQ